MKLSPTWLREFVDLKVDDRQLAEDLTSVGIAVEGISGEGTEHRLRDGDRHQSPRRHEPLRRGARGVGDLQPAAAQPSLRSCPRRTGKPDFAVEIIETQTDAPDTPARVIRDVKIKPSPDAIAKRLMLVDQRPINNAADATNYTLWEMGHPTHAFDLDLLEGGKIIVRRALDGETLKTLDGVDRKLSTEDLVIADAKKPVALAGVMGGFDTMITEKTKNILIESAWFDPATIRREFAPPRPAHRRFASLRARRRLRGHARACDRVAELILESAGGKLDGGAIDAVARPVDQAPIVLQLSEVHRILGEKLETNEIFRILNNSVSN